VLHGAIEEFANELAYVTSRIQIGDHDTAVVMHNDGVAQGLSEVPFMQDVEHWGVLTIGTGLGNARFSNRRKDDKTDGGDRKDK
jgi:hypothetical protein